VTAALRLRLGAVLRRERLKRGFSQEGFADALGMHRTYYGAIERGEKNLQLSTLSRVCAGLHRPLSSVIRSAEAQDLENTEIDGEPNSTIECP